MMASAEQDSRPVRTLWMLMLDESISMITPGVVAIFSRAGPEVAAELAEAMGEAALDEVQKRFNIGRRCYVARVNDKIVAYGWVSFDQEYVGELNLHLKLRPDEAYIWN